MLCLSVIINIKFTIENQGYELNIYTYLGFTEN